MNRHPYCTLEPQERATTNSLRRHRELAPVSVYNHPQTNTRDVTRNRRRVRERGAKTKDQHHVPLPGPGENIPRIARQRPRPARVFACLTQGAVGLGLSEPHEGERQRGPWERREVPPSPPFCGLKLGPAPCPVQLSRATRLVRSPTPLPPHHMGSRRERECPRRGIARIACAI